MIEDWPFKRTWAGRVSSSTSGNLLSAAKSCQRYFQYVVVSNTTGTNQQEFFREAASRGTATTMLSRDFCVTCDGHTGCFAS